MILGSSGFFGTSIIDFLNFDKNINKSFEKVILISRKSKNKIPKSFKEKYKLIEIRNDISKLKDIPYADYVIYSVITKNVKDDFRSIKNFIKSQ